MKKTEKELREQAELVAKKIYPTDQRKRVDLMRDMEQLIEKVPKLKANPNNRALTKEVAELKTKVSSTAGPGHMHAISEFIQNISPPKNASSSSAMAPAARGPVYVDSTYANLRGKTYDALAGDYSSSEDEQPESTSTYGLIDAASSDSPEVTDDDDYENIETAANGGVVYDAGADAQSAYDNRDANPTAKANLTEELYSRPTKKQQTAGEAAKTLEAPGLPERKEHRGQNNDDAATRPTPQ